jgi:HAD superfamily hydrolase (TIGR01509 family)
VFDMDGLLIDSEPLWHRAERAVLERRGLADPGLAKADTVGMAPAETMETYGQLLGLDESTIQALCDDLREQMRAFYATEAVVRPGAVDLVAALRGRIPLGIASNTGCELVLFALGVSGFDGAFDVVVSSEEVDQPKPAPDVYLEACRRVGVSPADAVALEDSPSGVASAKAAGLTVIAVPQMPGIDVSAADVVVASLVDLVGTLDP